MKFGYMVRQFSTTDMDTDKYLAIYLDEDEAIHTVRRMKSITKRHNDLFEHYMHEAGYEGFKMEHLNGENGEFVVLTNLLISKGYREDIYEEFDLDYDYHKIEILN